MAQEAARREVAASRLAPLSRGNEICDPAGIKCGTRTSPLDRSLYLRQQFRKRYGTEPRIFRAPGRVNLIGEHTDYNDGFVMPVAVDLYVWAAAAGRADARLVIYSTNFEEGIEIRLGEGSARAEGNWGDAVRGIAYFLESQGFPLRGASFLLAGDVPMGAGLGSSAAFEVSVAYALAEVSGLKIERVQLAQICQRAENDFAGARCGIMDQLISCCGSENEALFLDCRSLEYRTLPLIQEAALVVCNTKIKHAHASDEYNARRADCEAAARSLAQKIAGVHALRDVTPADLERCAGLLPVVIYRRCRHVVRENDRVLQAAAALEQGDPARFGQLMYESHRSLRDDFQVSCRELDILVELASQCDGVYGSRMTGGGFGGCTVSLVKREGVENFVSRVSRQYEEKTHSSLDVYVFNASCGVEELDGP